MIICAPVYYTRFQCIADSCRHSCCKDWEIDVDDASAKLYQTVPGKLGEDLRAALTFDEDGYHMTPTPEGRCPFLRTDGLCRIICEIGEGALCQICTDHPRFRNFFSDHTEIGLGLCCEAAANLIFGETVPFSTLPVGEDDEIPDIPDESEKYLLSLRENLLSICTDRSGPLAERIEKMRAMLDLPAPDLPAFIEKLNTLEILDPQWKDTLKQWVPDAPPKIADTLRENLLAYFLYRYMASCDPFAEKETLLFCLACTDAIAALTGDGDIAETARAFSAEIEYSTENIAVLLDYFSDFLVDKGFDL